jgi:hypothetical protein
VISRRCIKPEGRCVVVRRRFVASGILFNFNKSFEQLYRF